MNEFDKQLFKSVLRENPATESALHLSDVKVSMFQSSRPYAEHLMKMLVFGKVQDYNKWSNEVRGYIFDALDTKVRTGSKVIKYVPFDEAVECFFCARFDDDDTLEIYYGRVIEDNPEYTPCISFKDLSKDFWTRYRQFMKIIHNAASVNRKLDKSFLQEQIELLRGKNYGQN